MVCTSFTSFESTSAMLHQQCIARNQFLTFEMWDRKDMWLFLNMWWFQRKIEKDKECLIWDLSTVSFPLFTCSASRTNFTDKKINASCIELNALNMDHWQCVTDHPAVSHSPTHQCAPKIYILRGTVMSKSVKKGSSAKEVWAWIVLIARICPSPSYGLSERVIYLPRSSRWQCTSAGGLYHRDDGFEGHIHSQTEAACQGIHCFSLEERRGFFHIPLLERRAHLGLFAATELAISYTSISRWQ